MKISLLLSHLLLLTILAACNGASTVVTEEPHAVAPSTDLPNTVTQPIEKDTSVDVKAKILPNLLNKKFSSCERFKDFYYSHKATIYKDGDEFFVDYEISAHKESQCKDYAVEEIYAYSSYKIEKASVANPRTRLYNINLKVLNIWDYNDEVAGRPYNDYWASLDEFHKTYRKIDELFFTQLEISEDENHISIPESFKYSGDSRNQRQKGDLVTMNIPGLGGEDVLESIGELIKGTDYRSCSLFSVNGKDLYVGQFFHLKWGSKTENYMINQIRFYEDKDCSVEIADTLVNTISRIQSIKTVAGDDEAYDINAIIEDIYDINGNPISGKEVNEYMKALYPNRGNYLEKDDYLYTRMNLTLNSKDPTVRPTSIEIPTSGTETGDRSAQRFMTNFVELVSSDGGAIAALAKAEAAAAAE